MVTPDTINVAQPARLIATPDAPVIVDVRIDTDYASDPRTLPASVQRDYRTVSSWAEKTSPTSFPFLADPGQPALPSRRVGRVPFTGHRPLRRSRLWSRVVEAWRRYRSRQLLAGLDAHMLKDIGVTFAEAEHEANKPFWMR